MRDQASPRAELYSNPKITFHNWRYFYRQSSNLLVFVSKKNQIMYKTEEPQTQAPAMSIFEFGLKLAKL